jgi:hypothetical protein
MVEERTDRQTIVEERTDRRVGAWTYLVVFVEEARQNARLLFGDAQDIEHERSSTTAPTFMMDKMEMR